jgi:hypothetical protein
VLLASECAHLISFVSVAHLLRRPLGAVRKIPYGSDTPGRLKIGHNPQRNNGAQVLPKSKFLKSFQKPSDWCPLESPVTKS